MGGGTRNVRGIRISVAMGRTRLGFRVVLCVKAMAMLKGRAVLTLFVVGLVPT